VWETLLKTEHLDWLNEYMDSIEAEVWKLFPKKPTTTLEQAAVDALSNGGKRVRAVLALLMCEHFSGDYKPAVPIAVGYELAHACALVQDDIIDSSRTRRGTISIVSKYGLSNAILTSDFLLFNLPKIISKYGQILESRKLSKLFDLVGESCCAATWGEFLDLEMSQKRYDSIITELEYEKMIRSKTASLLAAPSASGAIIGGATEEETILAQKFGEWLGMAYQVHDDALDLFGDEQVLGKPIFTDLRAGKKNLILIHALSHSTENERQFMESLVGKKGAYDKEEVSRARDILEKHGSLQYAKARSVQYVSEAKQLTERLSTDSRAKRGLLALSDYLSERYY
jgi:geranylgeranyl diphosphate synthase, type I